MNRWEFRTATVVVTDTEVISTFKADGRVNRFWLPDKEGMGWYREVVRWAGYGEDWRRYAIEHNLTHHWLADQLGHPWSEALHDGDAERPLEFAPSGQRREEHLVNRLQRCLRTGQGDEYGAMEAQFEDLPLTMALLRSALQDPSVSARLRGTTCPVHPDHAIGLLGEAPGPRTRGDLPLYPYPPNSAAGRLLTMLGWERRRYLLTFARANVLDEYPGPSFPGTSVRARAAAEAKLALLAPRPVLLMGKGVAASLCLRADTPVLEWREIEIPAPLPPVTWRGPGPVSSEAVRPPRARVAIVPHPSGRNLWYNDPANRQRARDFVNELAGE